MAYQETFSSVSMESSMSDENLRIPEHECPVCHKRYFQKSLLINHLEYHNDTPQYKCSKCDKEFWTPFSLISHIRFVHGFECPVCGEIFGTIIQLRKHKAKHPNSHDDFPTPSGLLKSVRAQKSQALVRKILNEDGQKSINRDQKRIEQAYKSICDTCGKEFRASYMRKHKVRAHCDSYKYNCSACDYKTNRSDYFKRHMSRHDPAKDLSCEDKSCNYKFSSQSTLSTHIKKFHNPSSSNLQANGSLSGSKIKEEKMDFDQSYNQLQVATCSSLIKIENDQNQKFSGTKKPKLDYSVQYECVECKLDFADNTALWDHLGAVHFEKMRENK